MIKEQKRTLRFSTQCQSKKGVQSWKFYLEFLLVLSLGMGMGGGTILILLLSLFSGLEQHIAQATNLIFFIPTSLAAIIINIRAGLIDWKIRIFHLFFWYPWLYFWLHSLHSLGCKCITNFFWNFPSIHYFTSSIFIFSIVYFS